MKTPPLLLMALASLAALPLAAQKPAVPPKLESPPEIQKPQLFSETELRVIRAAPTLPTERLVELLSVYDKLDNTAMCDVLIRAILKRDPDNEAAISVRDQLDPGEETRPVGYLEEIARQVLDGKVIADPDDAATQAIALATEDRAADAVRLLEKLRSNQFQGRSFPYLDDLAFAYHEAGRLDDAIAAFEKVAADPSYAASSRSEAAAMLPSLRVRKKILAIRSQAGDSDDLLVALAAKLHRAHPSEHEAIAFHIEALDHARRYDEAVAILEAMKRKAAKIAAWPWAPTLAYAYFGSRRYDDAIAAFRAIHRDSGHDMMTRRDAEVMLVEITVNREIERGMAALTRADTAAARVILDRLLADFPAHPDTLGYHAIYLAKTGRGAEAEALLLARKAELRKQGLPFTQQDALADVYLERKDYFTALAAVREIIEDPVYDEEMRAEARVNLREIAVAQTLDAGCRALGNNNRSLAKKILHSLQLFAPGDLEVRIFAAEVALAYNRAAQSRDELLELKSQFPGQPFPGQDALGSSLFQTGEWEAAFEAYGEILSRPGYEPDDIAEATWQQRALRPLFRPLAELHLSHIDEQEGAVFGAEARYSTGWWQDWRITAFAHEDWISLDEAASYFEDADASRFDAGITLQRRFANGRFKEITIGGSEDEVIYGARVGKFASQALGWSLGFMGNQRSNESLSLMALDGREHRAEFRIGGPLAGRWVLDFAAYYHWIHVGGERLGDGFGFEGELDYIVQTETKKRPEIAVGYFGEYHRFDSVSALPPSITREIRRAVIPQEQVRTAAASNEEIRRAIPGSFGREVLDTLVDPETNRHGLQVTVRKHFADKWSAYAQAGAYYAFDDKSFEYTAAAGMEYYLSDTAMIYAEVRYDSNGRAANTGEGVIEANVGTLISF